MKIIISFIFIFSVIDPLWAESINLETQEGKNFQFNSVYLKVVLPQMHFI